MCHSDYNASHTINERLSERSSMRSSMITACSTALLGRIAIAAKASLVLSAWWDTFN